MIIFYLELNKIKWTWEDSNLWPHQCQWCALTNWATSSFAKDRALLYPVKLGYTNIGLPDVAASEIIEVESQVTTI